MVAAPVSAAVKLKSVAITARPSTCASSRRQEITRVSNSRPAPRTMASTEVVPRVPLVLSTKAVHRSMPASDSAASPPR
jgi:hypothetical protein